jgi:hypothetical protein
VGFTGRVSTFGILNSDSESNAKNNIAKKNVDTLPNTSMDTSFVVR